MSEELGYNPRNPQSIEEYAVQLVDKTFLQVIKEKGVDDESVILSYSNKLRKGGLGNLLEEVYFGYKANLEQEADFAYAGIELKVTPYEITKKGKYRAGERLVITNIGYDKPIDLDFYSSHLWNKYLQNATRRFIREIKVR